jgi:hypothetical protein
MLQSVGIKTPKILLERVEEMFPALKEHLVSKVWRK